MLLTLGLVLLALWFFAFVVFHVTGWLIHILLIVAVIVTLWRIVMGK